MMTDNELRDRCCWKRCRQESTMIFMGAGLCDAHWGQACSVFLPTKDYLLSRVIPEAASAIRAQDERNQEKTTTG